ncbi:MAG: DNA polymerase III subunit delta [Firmicutes bacterium]|nr:DNA polymerase III subunit delta [Bacillota bacterium]
MKFSELKEHLKSGKFFPVYILAGEDDGVVKLAKEQFIKLVDIPDFNVSYVSEGELFTSAEVLPLGSNLRLVFGATKQLNELDKYLANPNPSTVIILIGDAGKLKVSKGVEIVDCNRLDVGLLTKFIGLEAKKAGVSIDVDAAYLLIEYCTRFLTRIKSELDKLIGFCGNGKTIGVDAVKTIVAPDLEYKVFELADTIIKGNKERTMRMLDDMLNEGAGAAQKIFGLLYGHFRRLLFVSFGGDDAALAEKLGVKDYAVTVAKKQADKFSKSKLKRIVDKLHSVDYGIKSGKIKDRIALESFVMQI